jgi:hypothetical protein
LILKVIRKIARQGWGYSCNLTIFNPAWYLKIV